MDLICSYILCGPYFPLSPIDFHPLSLGFTTLATVSLPDNGTKALFNGLFETRKQPKLLPFPSHRLPKHRQSSLVPTSLVPAHGSLAPLAAFTPSCLFPATFRLEPEDL